MERNKERTKERKNDRKTEQNTERWNSGNARVKERWVLQVRKERDWGRKGEGEVLMKTFPEKDRWKNTRWGWIFLGREGGREGDGEGERERERDRDRDRDRERSNIEERTYNATEWWKVHMLLYLHKLP